MARDTGPSYGAFEQIAVSTTAVSLTEVPAYAVYAWITVEDAAIRFRVDGTAPTATVGHAAEIGDQIELDSRSQIDNFQAIRRDGVNSDLHVSYGV